MPSPRLCIAADSRRNPSPIPAPDADRRRRFCAARQIWWRPDPTCCGRRRRFRFRSRRCRRRRRSSGTRRRRIPPHSSACRTGGAGWAGGALSHRAFRPRHADDPERHRLAHLPRSRPTMPARCGSMREDKSAAPDDVAAAWRLYRACKFRHGAGPEEGAVARRDGARSVRHSRRRHPHRGQGRRCPHSVRTDPFRYLQGQPVRARRQARRSRKMR